MTSLHGINGVRRPDLHEMVHELCDTHTHREPYETRRGLTRIVQYHATTHPPLITQLADASQPSKTTDAGGSRPAATTAAARIDAIDTHIRIDHAAHQWLEHLGHYPDNRWTTTDIIRKLASLTPSQDPDTTRAIETDIRHWWTWARIITGWDTPAWAPANTCPLCNTRGTLRIRLDQHIATCTQCRATWDPPTIGLLANHIRAENNDWETEERTPA